MRKLNNSRGFKRKLLSLLYLYSEASLFVWTTVSEPIHIPNYMYKVFHLSRNSVIQTVSSGMRCLDKWGSTVYVNRTFLLQPLDLFEGNVGLCLTLSTRSNFIGLFYSLFWIILKWFVGVKGLILCKTTSRTALTEVTAAKISAEVTSDRSTSSSYSMRHGIISCIREIFKGISTCVMI